MRSRAVALSMLAFVLAGLFTLPGCGSAAKKNADKAAAAKKKRERKPNELPADTKADDKDKEWTTKLMADGGRWTYKDTDDDGNVTEYTEMYLPAGILNEKGDDETKSGTWEVKGGYLIWSLDNVKTVDKIKEISDKEFIYTDHETGKTVIETKQKD